MRGAGRIAAVALVLVCVLPTAGRAHDRCTPETTFLYCGEHLMLDRLPFCFRLNDTRSPLSRTDAEQAIHAAVATWNQAWSAVRSSGAGVETVSPLCYSGTTTVSFGRDGINAIAWGDPGKCGAVEAVAVACLWYEGGSGPDRHRIDEVDILLNPARSWKQPTAALDLALGVVEGSAPGITRHVRALPGWYDVQSALTHELGHALGLEDIGHDKPWMADVTDAAKHHQTMYRHYFVGSTNKRDLADGDLLGLYRAALDTATDRRSG